MSTVNTDVITFLQMIGCGEFGTDLFFGRVPQSQKTPVELWWVVPTSASVTRHNTSGEDTLTYQYELNFRSLSIQKVDEKIFKATKEIVGSHCYELDNFHTIEVSLVSTDQRTMMDSENRIVGSIAFSVTVYNILQPKNDESSQSESQQSSVNS